MRTQLKAFVAGFVSTLVFHQGVLHLLNVSGQVQRAAWNLDPVPPLGVPSVVSLAFFGGLWGILIWQLIRSSRGARRWALATVLGAILPSAVALFVVFPLKGMPLAGGWDPKLIVGALLLNGAWGLGLVPLMRAMRER